MRLFLAIFPPKFILDELRDVARKFTKQKRNLKYIPVDQMHMTLKFLGGNVSEESKELISEAFKANQNFLKAPEIQLQQIKFGFQFEKNPWILLANVKRTDSLVNLQDGIHEIIKSLKLRDTIRFKRKYANNFHISIARMKPNANKNIGKDIAKVAKEIEDSISKTKPFIAENIFLMESKITKGGPVYKKIETFQLNTKVEVEE